MKVAFWPLMGIVAWRNKRGGAFRLWLLAKSIDHEGSGALMRADLEFQAARLGVHPKSFRRWMRQALRLGLFQEVWKGARLVLASHERAAHAVGCEYVGPRRAELPVSALFGNGWKAHIWAGYLATHQRRPVTRAKLAELSGVPPSTQRTLEKAAEVNAGQNYMLTEYQLPKDSSQCFMPAWLGIRSHAFTFHNKASHERVVAWQGPNSYDAKDVAAAGRKGRSRKVNKALNHIGSSSKWGRGFDQEGDAFVRLFNEHPKQTAATLRKMARLDVPCWKVSEIFERRHTGPNAHFWRVVPTAPPGGLTHV